MSKIVIISGSHRDDSESRRIANYLAERCHALLSCTANVLDVAELDLPLWNENVWKGGKPWGTILPPIHNTLAQASGLLIIAPEWGGMVPPGLKNLLLLCNQNQIGHKPAMIVGVSASRGGAYPISELRTSAYKNNKIVFMPDHLIIRNCEQMLKSENPASDDDSFLRDKINWSLQVFELYMNAFDNMRRMGSETLFPPEHQNGM